MERKWKMILCVLLAAAVLGGVLALCLWEREPQGDTDPDAPFVDLPDRTKRKVLKAVSARLAPHGVYLPIFWYGEQDPARDPVLMEDIHRYGVRYYGTFGGYHIVLAPKRTETGGTIHGESIGGYDFLYVGLAMIFAYKDGVVAELYEVYEDGHLTKEQIGEIYQCYQKYNEEVYFREE